MFTRSGGVWSQQGDKLVGSGASGRAAQGSAVALSADGNTAIVGGATDGFLAGAVWVFTRSGGVWTQQGSKLVGTGAVGKANQGTSVDLSADGNTALVGGPIDSSSLGAVWVFTRSGGVWSQQGGKLVGTGVVGSFAYQGSSVGLSAGGDTAIVGGWDDDLSPSGLPAGAAWVFTRSGGLWSQQGSKLVASDNAGKAGLGYAVALSADGNTALVGGPFDDSFAGATWVFTRSGGVWAQQGLKLVGSGAVDPAYQGYSMALSGDGTTAIVGGNSDNTGAGAAWVFVSAATQLAFVQQPSTTGAGQTIAPAVTVQLEDSGGAPVAEAGKTITVSLSSGTGTLGGTLSRVTNAAGLATFDDLSIDLIGPKQLTAANPGRAAAVSGGFAITAAAPASIVVVRGTPQCAHLGCPCPEPLEVRVTDAFGNPVPGAVVTYTAPSSGPSAILSNGGSAATNASGCASVIATANDIPGGPYLVTATTGTPPGVTFALENLLAVPTLGEAGLLGLALLILAVGAISLRKP